ncbi:MAG: 30S ribosomal protein S5 [Promethearchaeota archaeon]
MSQKQGRKRRQFRPRKPPVEEWIPRTRVGRLVKQGIITSIDEIFQRNYRIMEKEIVDIFLPNLKEEVISIKMVQKQTDAGQQSRFKATVCVGNGDGYVGLGNSKNKEIGPAIRKAMQIAKLNIIPVKRGCGSWECGCGGDHSIPYETRGKCGSVRITLKPAPRGLGLAAADTAKVVLKLAGVQDIWSHTRGKTKTTENLAKAVVDGLKAMYNIMSPEDWSR